VAVRTKAGNARPQGGKVKENAMLTIAGKILLGLLLWGFVVSQIVADFRESRKPRRSLHA
jgi:hypothetical protein